MQARVQGKRRPHTDVASGLNRATAWGRSSRMILPTPSCVEVTCLIRRPRADLIDAMGGAKPFLAARVSFALAVLTIIGMVAPPWVSAQGPVREVPEDARLDGQRRRDAAAELRRLGLEVDWRLASLTELDDWVMRARRAHVLHDKFGVDVDWRTYGASELADFERRLVRAANLRRYGVSVDWRLYGTGQLDELQALVERQHASGALQPIGPATRTATATHYDRDEVLPPTYLAQKLPRDSGGEDDVLPPTFVGRRSRPDDRPLPLSRGAR